MSISIHICLYAYIYSYIHTCIYVSIYTCTLTGIPLWAQSGSDYARESPPLPAQEPEQVACGTFFELLSRKGSASMGVITA